jgi:hypothetical protein
MACTALEEIARVHALLNTEGIHGLTAAIIERFERISQHVEDTLNQSSMQERHRAVTQIANELLNWLIAWQSNNHPQTQPHIKALRQVAELWNTIVSDAVKQLPKV